MIWFNDEGTENGGFTFTGSKCETGTSSVTGRPCMKGTYQASTHFTFDQFDQDQIFVMNYNDQNGLRRVGIAISACECWSIHWEQRVSNFLMRKGV